MNFLSRLMTFGRRLVLASAFLIVAAEQPAGAREGGGPGPGGGGAGVQKAKKIVISQYSRSNFVRKLFTEISENWNQEYTLTIENSTPRVSRAIVKMARFAPAEAARLVTVFITRSRHNFVNVIHDVMEQIESLERSISLRKSYIGTKYISIQNKARVQIEMVQYQAQLHLYKELLVELKKGK